MKTQHNSRLHLKQFRQLLLASSLILYASLACQGNSQPPFLLLITSDTLRADRLGCYGNELGLTTNLDQLAQQSLRFEFAFAPASFTLASVSSIFTGRYPEENRIYSNVSRLAEPRLPLQRYLNKKVGLPAR